MAPSDDRERTLEWVERVATFCGDAWGLAPITGRVLGWLLICTPAEQSAGEIADAIGASRASMTSNLRLLTSIGLVRRHTRPGERTTYYRIEDDAFEKVVRQRLASFAAFGEIAEEGLELGGEDEERTRRIRSAQHSIALLTHQVR
ncbi:helix-turn-helix domain-containing protein [Nonomuraea jabiensis]|uniref:DNA-binding transcriptional regulator GbsR (MarR family) n=1 Tax=Nonomuraea jabiensis TaxID=882448 RepID=A0A7W9G6E2_9ACTN|nr:helix-turn-helix domain-containing protein [Nonomuraea jabiensis]MBB5777993.1 DNA-binding transcriptional regulator GbsR (MarR family) [Nonomuraea jabiensis]